jgi:hypothetical protein
MNSPLFASCIRYNRCNMNFTTSTAINALEDELWILFIRRVVGFHMEVRGAWKEV